MKLYIAAQFSRQSEVANIAAELAVSDGHIIVSDWLFEVEPKVVTSQYLGVCSERDLADIDDCDVFVLIESNPVQLTNGIQTGGRHVEMGWALAKGRPVAVVGAMDGGAGPGLNVHQHNPLVHHVHSVEGLRLWLKDQY